MMGQFWFKQHNPAVNITKILESRLLPLIWPWQFKLIDIVLIQFYSCNLIHPQKHKRFLWWQFSTDYFHSTFTVTLLVVLYNQINYIKILSNLISARKITFQFFRMEIFNNYICIRSSSIDLWICAALNYLSATKCDDILECCKIRKTRSSRKSGSIIKNIFFYAMLHLSW